MKRFIPLLLAVVLILSVTACAADNPPETQPASTKSSQTKPVQTQPVAEEPEVTPLDVLVGNQYISEWNDDYALLGYVTWDSLTLGKDSAAAYPKLASAVDSYCKKDAAQAEDTLQDMLPDAREMAATMGDDFYGLFHETTCTIQRADNLILSARYDYYAFTGGNRPYYGTTVLNLDPTTGENMKLSQVVTDLNQLPRLLTQALEEKYTDFEKETLSDIQRILKNYGESAYTWTLNYQGITFYFGVSEITPSAAGALEVTLWFDRNPKLFAEEFTRIPKGGYALRLPENTWLNVDMNPNDDIRDEVYVSMDDDGTLYVAKNGNMVEDSSYFAYYCEAYILTADNEHFYLYVDGSAENDYSIFRVFDLNGKEPVCLGCFLGEGFAGVWAEDYLVGPTWFNYILNDPSHFQLAGHLNVLGTMSGIRNFFMNPKTGIPTAETEYYYLPEDREPLVTKIPLTVKLLPGLKDVEIPAGTKLWFLRSDGETYVDMLMSNGKECRIFVTYRDWTGYVNGIPEHDCFDGILYAG